MIMKNYKKKTKSQRPIPYFEQPLYDIKKHKVGIVLLFLIVFGKEFMSPFVFSFSNLFFDVFLFVIIVVSYLYFFSYYFRMASSVLIVALYVVAIGYGAPLPYFSLYALFQIFCFAFVHAALLYLTARVVIVVVPDNPMIRDDSIGYCIGAFGLFFIGSLLIMSSIEPFTVCCYNIEYGCFAYHSTEVMVVKGGIWGLCNFIFLVVARYGGPVPKKKLNGKGDRPSRGSNYNFNNEEDDED